ncbi:MAG: hypothetical protein FH761_17865 [Firmicutes bacterium]|nr:hypothetical protein [Bacillota bacterium]
MAKSISIDTEKIEKLTKELKGFEKEVGVATYHALNRVLNQTRTQVGRIVPKVYAIKAREVKASFDGGMKKPSYNKLEASLTSKGKLLSLAHFPHSPTQPRKTKYKVKATVKRAEGRKQIRTNPKPFVASTGAKSDDKTKYNIFKREGSKRTPITVLRTLSIPQMISNETVENEIQEFAISKLNERLQHEIERSMTSIGGRIR